MINDTGRYVLVVHPHLEPGLIRAIAFLSTSGIHRGMTVYDRGPPLHVPVHPACLGRMLNVFGEPLGCHTVHPRRCWDRTDLNLLLDKRK